MNGKEKVLLVAYVASLILILRLVGYKTGIIASAVDEYFVPTILWTIVFCITMGIIVTLLLPFWLDGSRVSVIRVLMSLGVNWLWFNSFMALIMKGFTITILIRVGIDLFGIVCAICTYQKRRK